MIHQNSDQGTPKMYLDIGKKCPSKALICVPHLPEPITVKKFAKQFPDFASMMDGQSKENTLLFYWKYNKQEGVYVFISEEEEDEVAELLGVKLYDGSDKDSEGGPENRQLTEEEIKDFREYLKEVNEGMKEWNERTKEMDTSL